MKASETKHTFYLYSEQCLQAGHKVPDSAVNIHDGDPGNCTDWDQVSGCNDELRKEAQWFRQAAKKSNGGHGAYLRECAKSIYNQIRI